MPLIVLLLLFKALLCSLKQRYSTDTPRLIPFYNYTHYYQNVAEIQTVFSPRSVLIVTVLVLEVNAFSWKYLSVCQHVVIQDLKTALSVHQEKDIIFLSNH